MTPQEGLPGETRHVMSETLIVLSSLTSDKYMRENATPVYTRGQFAKIASQADMDKFGGLIAERMDAEQSHVATAENELQEAICVANDPAASSGIVRTTAYEVRHSFLPERLLGLADHTDLWDGIDSGGEYVGKLGSELVTEGIADRPPPLFHAGGRQRGKANHIARCIDVWHRRAKVIVHNDESTRADWNAGSGKIQSIRVALPAGGNHHRLDR